MNRKIRTVGLVGMAAWMGMLAGCSDKPADKQTLVQPAIEKLKNEDQQVRQQAATTLGASKSPQAVPPLIDALATDANPKVRQLAATALGQIGDPRAIQPLIRALGMESERAAARASLMQIGKPAVEPLIEALATPGEARLEIVHVLGELGDGRALPPLLNLQAEEDKKAHDGDLLEQEARRDLIVAVSQAVNALKSLPIAPTTGDDKPRAGRL